MIVIIELRYPIVFLILNVVRKVQIYLDQLTRNVSRALTFSVVTGLVVCSQSLPASRLFEYQWPHEKGAEWYMLQEQVCDFLAVVSFKRKYPGESTAQCCIIGLEYQVS